MNKSVSLDPAVFLGVGTMDGEATELFCAFHLTQACLARLRLLTSLCGQHGIKSVRTRDIAQPLYWDIPPGIGLDAENLAWTWRTVGTRHYAELTVRRYGRGGTNDQVNFQTQVL